MPLTAYKIPAAGEPDALPTLVRNPEQGCNLTGFSVAGLKRRSLLPLLTVLFLISYGLMTMLIVEQGNTIQSQRYLIQQLFNDSVELSSMKGKAAWEKNHPTPKGPAAQATPAKPETSEVTPQEHKKIVIPRVGPKVNANDSQDVRRLLLIG